MTFTKEPPDPPITDEDKPEENFELITQLTKDLRVAARTMGRREARYLVDSYYIIQDSRIRAQGQVRSMEQDAVKAGEDPEPHELLNYFVDQFKMLENQVKSALDQYSKSQPVGTWLRGIIGIGPVIAAGLLSQIDLDIRDKEGNIIGRRNTAGAIWSFAGLDPTKKWKKGEKRPWNAKLKTLCFKAGESFIKQQNNPKDIYGKLFVQRKKKEWVRNLNGEFAEQARGLIPHYEKDTGAKKWYTGCITRAAAEVYLNNIAQATPEKRAALKPVYVEAGHGVQMLPPGHIHSRARRYAVKIFLSHLHEVMYIDKYNEKPPAPFAIAILGHADKIEPSQ